MEGGTARSAAEGGGIEIRRQKASQPLISSPAAVAVPPAPPAPDKMLKNHAEAREFSDGKSSVGFYPSSLPRWRAAPSCPAEAPNICLLGL